MTAVERRRQTSQASMAAISVLSTADALRRHFGVTLAPYEITLPQYNVLRVLRGAGPEGLPTLEVGERLIEQAPGITRMMDRLEERGWVTRERCPDDRRQVICYLSRAGKALVDRLDGPVDAADEAAVGALTVAEQRDLIRLLEKVRTTHE